MTAARPKLLVLLPFLTPSIGGGAFALLNLLEPLAREGFDLAVVYFQERAAGLIPPSIRRHALPKRTGKVRYYAEYWRLVFGLAELLRREKPDIVLCNSYQPYWAALIARRLSGSSARIVGGEQNNVRAMLAGSRLEALRMLLTRWLAPKADRIVVPSSGIGRALVEDVGVPPQRIVTIPNAVPVAQLARRSSAPAEHPWLSDPSVPVALNVGALDPQKDQAALLRAVALLRRSRPLRCLVIGEGPERASLAALARELGVSDGADFLGFQPDPCRYMSRASVFVLSSRYEGFGLVLVEALASGCPVVSTDCPYGPAEILAPEGREPCGLLVPPGDPEALAAAIRRVLEERGLRDALVSRGRFRAQDFAEDSIARRYAEVLREAA